MDISTFSRTHIPQLTAVVGLVTYGLARNKFTTGGVLAGILVSMVHMCHPWPAFFWLLTLFVFFGTLVTKIGHHQKSHLTQSSTGQQGGEGARSSAQVFANSGFACVLILLHLYLLSSTPYISSTAPISAGIYAPVLQKLLPVGIVAQYAAVAADTFSSELGILAKSQPRMITALWRKVPPGTNGGVTVEGVLYGGLGSVLLTGVAVLMLYISPPRVVMSGVTVGVVMAAGLMGSIIDSVLGALLQATVTEKRSGRVVEGPGGTRVMVQADGSRVKMGRDLLSNNGVNFWMAALTSLLAMGVAYVLGLELSA